MNLNTSGQIKNGISAEENNEGTLLNYDASNAIVQCLLIAARRGRQIRLAREQAAQLESQQSGSGPSNEETSPPNGM